LEKVISISFGEIALKGSNRKYFEDKLIKEVVRVIRDIGYENIYKEIGKIYIKGKEEDYPKMINRLKKVFGIVYISICMKFEKDMDKIIKNSILAMKEAKENRDIKTFKVKTNRADKKFSYKSPEVSRKIGGILLDEISDLKVDIHDPDTFLYIDIKQNVYIYTDRIKGHGGMPIGSNGKALLLLSGGIDSPVAGFMMANRGLDIDCLHFHSYPFTSERAEEKVKDLAKILSRYIGNIRLFSVNILEIQKAINENCPAKEMTIISRKFMMRIGEKIAQKNGYKALITGESLGQVASQTIQGIAVTNESVNLPIFRPLIAVDKVDITKIARDIDTFDTSILPFEDCCTVFLPKHPVTNPNVEDIKKSEELLDIDSLIQNAIDNMKIININ
jgi:tRNA uracil 4-sulfurtransferase